MNSSPIKARAYTYIGWYIAIICILISFGSGVIVGRRVVSPVSAPNGIKVPEIQRVINIDRSKNPVNEVDFNQFWQVWDRVKRKYVKQPVKDTDLFYGALQGLVGGLGDPYSVYFTPQAAEEFNKSLAGEFSGIGAEIGVKNNQLVIISPLPHSPAERAGLRPGDKVLAIDKRITLGMDVTSAVTKIRGPAGTTTTLTIVRDGLAKAQDIVIVRERINIPAILFGIKSGNVAYIRVMQFNDDTIPQFNNAIKKLKQQKAKGIIIDLRSNPGGLLESAVAMASEWVPEGVIVSEKLYNGEARTHDTVGAHRLVGMPTVALTNGGSASASEIVAGALHDYGAAKLVGEKTFGKGSVQDLEEFPDGSSLKITIAEWFTPKGININEKGISPDIEVKEDFEKEKVGEDVMINKAMEVLKK